MERVRTIGQERERVVAPAIVPLCMEHLVEGYEWGRETIGESGGAAYRLRRHGCPALYLKYGCGAVARDIIEEMVRLRWLAGKIPVPAVRHFVASGDEAWLLMTALAGKTAYQSLEADPASRTAIVDILASFLRRFHALPIEACPFNSDHRLRLIHARGRLAAGIIDTYDFNDDHKGWSAEQVWNEMMDLLPFSPDTVVTHGDFSLDNILIEGGQVVGCIDVCRAGSADRYQDLAILWNCLGEFGDTLQRRLFDSYGISNPDERKLRFHLALDECF